MGHTITWYMHPDRTRGEGALLSGSEVDPEAGRHRVREGRSGHVYAEWTNDIIDLEIQLQLQASCPFKFDPEERRDIFSEQDAAYLRQINMNSRQ